jgi:hypothetical protein
MWLARGGEAASDGITELGRHQLILDPGRPGGPPIFASITPS